MKVYAVICDHFKDDVTIELFKSFESAKAQAIQVQKSYNDDSTEIQEFDNPDCLMLFSFFREDLGCVYIRELEIQE